MLRLLEDLPVELVGTNVFGYLSLKDIVMLERACGSKKSHQAFMEQIPQIQPVVLPSSKHTNISTMNWFAYRQCKLYSLYLLLPGDNPGLGVINLKVDYFDLQIDSNITIERMNPLLESNMGFKVKEISIYANQNKEVIEQLSACTENVKQLTIINSYNCMDWLTADILSRWKLKAISLDTTLSAVLLIVQTCTELTSIKLYSDNINEAVVIAIAQHCTKLETLLLRSSNITWTSLLALSERCLLLEELYTASISNIPTADIDRRCTDTCMLALSEHCPQLQWLDISIAKQITEVAVLQLLQRCPKLTKLEVSSSSLSKETWTSLDKNTQKRVRRWGS